MCCEEHLGSPIIEVYFPVRDKGVQVMFDFRDAPHEKRYHFFIFATRLWQFL